MTPRHGPTDRRWHNLPVVRERDRRGFRWLLALTLGTVIALSPLAVYVLHQMHYLQVRYRIEEIRQQQEFLQKAEERLRSERASLLSPVRVERRARRLGLMPASPESVIVVEPGLPTDEPLMAKAPAEGELRH